MHLAFRVRFGFCNAVSHMCRSIWRICISHYIRTIYFPFTFFGFRSPSRYHLWRCCPLFILNIIGDAFTVCSLTMPYGFLHCSFHEFCSTSSLPHFLKSGLVSARLLYHYDFCLTTSIHNGGFPWILSSFYTFLKGYIPVCAYFELFYASSWISFGPLNISLHVLQIILSSQLFYLPLPSLVVWFSSTSTWLLGATSNTIQSCMIQVSWFSFRGTKVVNE